MTSTLFAAPIYRSNRKANIRGQLIAARTTGDLKPQK